jgi:hypothetical protein
MNDVSQPFAMFMDRPKMLAIFQQELPDCLSGGWQLTGCQIQHPRYKTYLNPGSRNKSFLAVAYHLKGVIQPTQKAQDRIVYVKAYLSGRSLAEYEKACAELQDNPQHLPTHIEKYGMVTWLFPYDPAFPGLSKVMNSDGMRTYFTDTLFAGNADFAFGIKDIAVQIINYRPEIRCTYRYALDINSGAKQILYGKSFADEKGAEIYRRITTLYKRGKHKSDCFALPAPIAYDESLNTLWMEALKGNPLIENINQSNADELMTQVARYLADFHKAELSGLEAINEDDLLAEIQKKSAKLQNAFPALAARFESVVLHLAQQEENLPHIPHRLIHGDFHIQQLLQLSDNRIALFDFDELALANPLVDVANFCADLYNLDFETDLRAAIINSLYKGYKSFSDYDLTDAYFDWHLRIQLLTRAYRAFIQQKPDLERLVSQLLVAAELGYTEIL